MATEKRLIDANALKAYINSKSTHSLNEWDTIGVLAAVDKQPSVDAVEVVHGRWIPVTERLPEESGAYLVATERGGVFITHYSKRGQRFSISRMGSDVTHWQERPLPPKGED